VSSSSVGTSTTRWDVEIAAAAPVQVLDALVAKSVTVPLALPGATSSVSVSRSVGTSIVAPKTAWVKAMCASWCRSSP